MTLPTKVTSLVFSTDGPGELCGIALGDRFSGLTLPAFWSDSHSDGKVRFGWLEVEEAGISQLCCSVTDTLGRVSAVEVSLELESEAAEKQVFGDLGELLTRRCGKGTKAKKLVEWPVPGALEGRLGVRNASFSMEGDRVYRVEVTLSLAPGVEIVADKRALFIDVEALAEVLQSAAWPKDRCAEVLERYFSKETAWRADPADSDAYKRILMAAKAERGRDLPAMMDRVCALMDWSDADKGRDSVRATYVLKEIGSFSYNNSITRGVPPGCWLLSNPIDIICFVRLLGGPVAERGAWAAKVVRAIEWGDEAAAEAVRRKIAAQGVSPNGALVWDSTDEVEARMFDLVTSGRAEEARVLWPLEVTMYDASAARACVSFYERNGKPRPKVKASGKDDHSELDWATYAAFLKESFPALFEDAMIRLAEKLKLHTRTLRAVCDEVADTKSHGDSSIWHFGSAVVTHTGKEARGRWTIKKGDGASGKKAAKKTAKK